MCCLNFSGLRTRSNQDRGKSLALAILISSSCPLSEAMTLLASVEQALTRTYIHLFQAPQFNLSRRAMCDAGEVFLLLCLFRAHCARGKAIPMEGEGKHDVCMPHLVNIHNSYAGAKRQLLELKKELKCWETMFERKHGRKPNRVSGGVCVCVSVAIFSTIFPAGRC